MVVVETVRSLLAEPRVSGPPVRVWRDWVLVVAFVVAVAIEEAVRNDLVWPIVSLIPAAGVAVAVLVRRTEPLLAVVTGFGPIIATDVAGHVFDVEWVGLNSMVILLVLPYALFRWAAGQEAAYGLAIMSVTLVLSWFDDSNTVGDMIGGGLVLLFPAALGATVRYEYNARNQELEQIKLLEREQLARELHDTVAHHVSAIAIQAQAGQALAASKPEAAIEALAVIEEEASRTLAEMRSMVGALRQGEEPDMAPQPGAVDIPELAAGIGSGSQARTLQASVPHITVELSGELSNLRPSVDTTLYRLAQESITNAIRHARAATRIDVRVTADDDLVRLEVTDDGKGGAADGGSASGYGLVGMTERAKLLGGWTTAGPGKHRGWTVEAVIPRNEAPGNAVHGKGVSGTGAPGR